MKTAKLFVLLFVYPVWDSIRYVVTGKTSGQALLDQEFSRLTFKQVIA